MKQVTSFEKSGAKYWGQEQGQTLTKKTQKKSFLSVVKGQRMRLLHAI